VNANGQISVGSGVVKPTVASYSVGGNVNLSTQVHKVDTSAGLTFDLIVPNAAGNTEIEGITYSFFDIGFAAATNWAIKTSGGAIIATATANDQIIRITLIAGEYKIG
jgi:hypothetical protein